MRKMLTDRGLRRTLTDETRRGLRTSGLVHVRDTDRPAPVPSEVVAHVQRGRSSDGFEQIAAAPRMDSVARCVLIPALSRDRFSCRKSIPRKIWTPSKRRAHAESPRGWWKKFVAKNNGRAPRIAAGAELHREFAGFTACLCGSPRRCRRRRLCRTAGRRSEYCAEGAVPDVGQALQSDNAATEH